MKFRIGLRLATAGIALLTLAKFAPAQPAAQAPERLAVINLQRAVLESAEIKKASADMEAKYKPRTDKLQELQRDLASISQQLQNGAGKLTPQAEADLQAKGQREQRDAQRMQEDLQADVDRERNDILSASTKKMQEIVKKIATEKGYDLVVDVTNAIFYKPALDITNDAIAAYDKAYPAK
ncbi:MAG TPA: OmpH family outer membrane protein [Bryobacteraceae bacterium]|nr:OmpH family outer membrane protein [Bryobacteraceae bacterium]